VNNLPDRGLKSVIASISVQAGVVGKPLRVSSTTDLVVGLVEIPRADDKITLLVALKTGSRHDIEDSVRPVSVGGIVAASQDLEVIDILRVNLRRQIAGNVGVGDGNSIDQPLDLVASSHVQHIVCHVCGRHVIRDHG